MNKFWDWCFGYNTTHIEHKPEKFSDLIKIIGIVLYFTIFIMFCLLNFAVFYFEKKNEERNRELFK